MAPSKFTLDCLSDRLSEVLRVEYVQRPAAHKAEFKREGEGEDEGKAKAKTKGEGQLRLQT